MIFLDLIEDVFVDHIFPNLSWNELLRLRRTCWVLMTMVDKTLLKRCLPESVQVLLSDGDDQMDYKWLDTTRTLPSPRNVYIRNTSGAKFFASKQAKLFAQKYGGTIRKLRVYNFSLGLNEDEAEFFAQCTGLKSLEIEKTITVMDSKFLNGLDETKDMGDMVEKFEQYWEPLPHTLTQLEELSFELQDKNITREVLLYCLMFSGHCRLLKSVSHAYTGILDKYDTECDFGRYLHCLAMHILGRHADLEICDMKNFCELPILINAQNGIFISAFLEAVKSANIQLKNFCAETVFFSSISNFEALYAKTLSKNIISMYNMNPVVQKLTMENLKQLYLTTSKVEFDILAESHQNHVGKWPNLQHLEICINSIMLGSMITEESEVVRQHHHFIPVPTMQLFWSIFKRGAMFASLAVLKLVYDETLVETCKALNIAVAKPHINSMIDSCPNIKELCLTNWPGTNKCLTKIWERLTLLEKVSLVKCPNLGNVAFVGEHLDRPVFLGLNRLKTLELIGLERMPKITDTLFKEVISLMPLCKLVLQSSKHVDKITLKGLECLKMGKFASTIERFTIDDLLLQNTTLEEVRAFEKQFRSYNMI